VRPSDDAIELLELARATLRITFRPRLELRAVGFFLDFRFVAAKVAADYADCDEFGKAKFAAPEEHRLPPRSFRQLAGNMQTKIGRGIAYVDLGTLLRWTGSQPVLTRTPRLRTSHVAASAGVDLDVFPFPDEKRNVDCFARLQFCRFGDVAGGIATYAFGGFNHF